VDFGMRRIGLALSDETETLARPLRALRVASVREAPAVVADAVRAEEAKAVVVGMPVGLEGEEGRAETRRVVRFAKALRAATGVPVHLQDESLSSREARSLGDARGRADRDGRGSEHARAAAVVLQRWLDARRSGGGVAGAPGGAAPEGDAR
jgi:putative Holliday junction resolvase